MNTPVRGEYAYLGTALHAPVRGELQVLQDALIVASADGRINAVLRGEEASVKEIAGRFAAAGKLLRLRPGQYLLPGFVDLHVHAPQWPQLGTALDLPLEEWLQAHTFPLEARYADLDFARPVYESLVDTLLANGTTTAMYYGSLHRPATQLLADICLRRSQRALIGRVAMDDPRQCPAYYRDASARSAEAETRAFITYVRSLRGNEGGVVSPVITPRFIPSCTDELLERLGRLAQESNCHVQTHCSESDWEHRYVLERCGKSDAAALDEFGLLGRRTILAHCNFLSDEDLVIVKQRGAGVAHCPLSNAYFSDAAFPLRRILARGVNVGLGTDIAGGASPSILENARQAVVTSRMLESGVDPGLARTLRGSPDSRISTLTAFWLATTGGGVALDLPIGVFREGYQFDAVLVDASAPEGNLRVGPADSGEQVLQKVLYHAGRSNLSKVWVGNRQVHGTVTSS